MIRSAHKRSPSCAIGLLAVVMAIGPIGAVCAQSLNWAVCGGPVGSNSVMDLAYDANGDLYVGGYVAAGALDIDPGTDTLFVQSGGTSSSLLAKYAANGELLWAHVFGDTLSQRIHAVAPDGQGGVVVFGLFASAFDIDPGPGTWTLTTPGGLPSNTAFVARFDANGALLWAFSLGAEWAYVFPGEVAVDNADNAIVIASFDTNTGSGVDMDPGPAVHALVAQEEDMFVAKYSPTGAYLWAFTLGGVEDFEHGYGVTCDGDDNVYVTGDVRSMGIDADPGPGQYLVDAVNTRKHMLLASYEPGGAFRWAFTVGAAPIWSVVEPHDITVDHDDNLIVTGAIAGMDLDFDPSADTSYLDQALAGSTFLAKYSAAGELGWCTKLDGLGLIPGTMGNRGRSVACTPANEIVLAGEFTNDTLDADPSPGLFPLQRIGSVGDTFAAQFTANGGLINAFNISSSSHASPWAVACGNGGAMAIGGHFAGTGFDPEPWTPGPTYDAGYNSLYLAVYKDLATGLTTDPPRADGLLIVPNPTNGSLRIEGLDGADELRMIDALGQEMWRANVIAPTMTIDLSGRPGGIYLITVRTGDEVRALRVMKE